MLVVQRKYMIVVRLVAQVMTVLVMAGLAGTAADMLFPGAAHAEDTQGFSGAPADGDHSDPTRTRYSFSAEPGQTINDFYYIENSGTVAQDISVYATDAFNAADGAFSLLGSTIPATGIGTWVTIDGAPREVVTLAPQSSKVVAITISVPPNARPGDHVGGIIASAVGSDGQVKLERRVASRLYIRISGELQPGLTVGGLTANYQPDLNPFNGKVILTYTVKNTGNIALGGNSASSVSGLFGVSLSGIARSSIPELLPDGTHEVTTEVPGVWQWVWMNVKSSLVGIDSNEAMRSGAMPTSEREASTWAVPWALLVLVMTAGFIVLYIRFSRQNNERRSQQWIEYTEAEARLRARAESTES
jgi:hypothetical protein